MIKDDGSFRVNHGRKVSIAVTRKAPLPLDFANMAGGGFKAVEDAVVRLGYATDDSPDWIDWPPKLEQVVSDAPETVIVLRLI